MKHMWTIFKKDMRWVAIPVVWVALTVGVFYGTYQTFNATSKGLVMGLDMGWMAISGYMLMLYDRTRPLRRIDKDRKEEAERKLDRLIARKSQQTKTSSDTAKTPDKYSGTASGKISGTPQNTLLNTAIGTNIFGE